MKLPALALILTSACGSVTPEVMPDAATADAGTEDTASADDVAPDACAADPTLCLYQDTRYPIEKATSSFVDATRVGGDRMIGITIRYAPTAPRPMPMVILSHGGAEGQVSSETALEEWATVLAEAGYFAVAIAHTTRTIEQRQALCMSLGINGGACPTFKFLSYDRPLDIARTIDRAIALDALPELAGHIDTSRIAVLGHSAGAGGTLMVAGAPRDMNGSRVLDDPRPMAFVALSPQAPGSDGFDAEGYGRITRPTLIVTGRGDENPPDTADARAKVFDALAPGDKARLFIENPAAVHPLFAHDVQTCAGESSLALCEQMASWMRSGVLSFLDVHLRSSADATAYIASDSLARASGNAAEWEMR